MSSKKQTRRRKRNTAGNGRRLEVWAERREPDWDRFVAVMVTLALRRVEEREKEERGGADE
jgi:hypothetical protein